MNPINALADTGKFKPTERKKKTSQYAHGGAKGQVGRKTGTLGWVGDHGLHEASLGHRDMETCSAMLD